MDFKQTEQTRRLVEVTALQALSEIYMNRNLIPKIAECEKQLRQYAFPEEIDLSVFESPAEIKAYHYCGDDDCKGDCE